MTTRVLQITSRLHQNQIVRGMKRLILGLGELPSTPQVQFFCSGHVG